MKLSAASGNACLCCVQGVMKSDNYQRILGGNLVPGVSKMDLRPRSWYFQQDKAYFKKLSKMDGSKALESSKMASNESGFESH